MKNWIRVFTCALTLLLGACVSLPEGVQPLKASAQQDAEAKRFQPKADKAMVYIYRNNYLGHLMPLGINMNGQLIGGLQGYHFFALELAPGDYTFQAKQETETVYKLAAKAGQKHFIWLDLSTGVWGGRPAFHAAEEKEAQKAILDECNLAIPKLLMAAPAAAK